jgi:thiol:disulfide interchange protein
LLVTLLMLARAGEGSAADAIRFEPFTTHAYDAARRSGAPFVIEFTADWCEPCREMHERTFTDPGVRKAALGVRFLEVDMTSPDRQTDRIMQSFRIPGAPTTLVFGADGKERERRIGFIGAEEFVKLLAEAKGAVPPAASAERGI